MAFITAYVFTMYAFKRNNHKLWNLTRDFVHTKKMMGEIWIRQKVGRAKVEPAIETSVEDCGKFIESIAVKCSYAGFNRQFQLLVYACKGGWEVRYHIAGYADKLKMAAV